MVNITTLYIIHVKNTIKNKNIISTVKHFNNEHNNMSDDIIRILMYDNFCMLIAVAGLPQCPRQNQCRLLHYYTYDNLLSVQKRD